MGWIFCLYLWREGGCYHSGKIIVTLLTVYKELVGTVEHTFFCCGNLFLVVIHT